MSRLNAIFIVSLIAASALPLTAQQPAVTTTTARAATKTTVSKAALAQAKKDAMTMIQGNALSSTNGHLNNAVVRLRDARYGRINTWEAALVDQGVVLVKVFLHLSYEEQKARLLARLDDPTKHWKVGSADVAERARWDDYQAAYADVLGRCNPDSAPWYVIPADHKWYRDWALTNLLVETLTDLHLTWPEPDGVDIAVQRKQLLTT